MRKFPMGIMFHHFHNNRHYGGQGSISKKDFEKIIHYIKPWRILDPHDWIERVNRGLLTKNDLCLTFDDALLCQYEIALPILEKYNLRAFWFVYSSVFEGGLGKFEIYRLFRSKFFKNMDDFYKLFFSKIQNSRFEKSARLKISQVDIDRFQYAFPHYSVNDIRFRMVRDKILNRNEYESIMDGIIRKKGLTAEHLAKNLWMTNKHLKDLSDHGHAIGLHSYTHPMIMGSLSFSTQKEEYQKNFNHIVEITGKPPLSMSHPDNSYNDHTLKILKQLKIICGFRSNKSPPNRGKVNQSQYELAREDHTHIIKLINKRKSYENKQP